MASNEKQYDDEFDWDDAVGSGLLDTYVGTVLKSEAATDPEYNDGETLRMCWDIRVDDHDDPDVDIDPGDELEEAFNIGNTETWEALDGGRKVAKVDGKRPKFNNNSGIGRLIASVNPRGKEPIEGADELAKILRERGPGTDMSIWEGLTFRFERLEFSFTPKGEDKVVYHRVYPTAFLGEAEKAGKAKKGKGKKSTKAEAESTEDDGPTRADLLALAAEHESYSKFLAAAMSTYDGVEDGEHAKELMDQDNGIYAEAHEG